MAKVSDQLTPAVTYTEEQEDIHSHIACKIVFKTITEAYLKG